MQNPEELNDLIGMFSLKRRRKRIKVLGVLYKGGKCQKCGYNKNMNALEFHHRDPSKKDFTISQRANHAWKSIKEELDKCDILCVTCHRELHSDSIGDEKINDMIQNWHN